MVHQLMEDLMLGGGVFVIVALNLFLLMHPYILQNYAMFIPRTATILY